MNKPVAWRKVVGNVTKHYQYNEIGEGTPLYIHPVKEQKCIVKDCENHKHEGGFVGDLCKPCHQFITTGEGIYSQAYRNANPVKELTLSDQEIDDVWAACSTGESDTIDMHKFAEAILRKAQEK